MSFKARRQNEIDFASYQRVHTDGSVQPSSRAAYPGLGRKKS